jgi:CRISPR-associated exonuclease Cas4
MTITTIASYLFLTSALALVLGIILRRLARHLRLRKGFPEGKIFYDDTAGRAGELLHSERLSLCGKPDYLLVDRGNLIPVEIKSSYAPGGDQPYESHLMQLAAYFVLIEDVLGPIPPHGFIRYRDRTMKVDNTEILRARIFDVIDRMRALLMRDQIDRSHNQPARCARCSMADLCDESLGGGD